MVVTSSGMWTEAKKPEPEITQPLPSPQTTTIKSDGGRTSYYDIPEGAKELNDLIEHKNMNFALANIFKACYRLGEKDGVDKLYDINKIIYYGERLKSMVEKGQF